MQTFKFGFKYFKKDLFLSIVAEILSIIGIGAEFLIPMLSALLIDFCIQSSEIKEDSGKMFHFLLSGKYGEVHSMQLFYNVAIIYGILMLFRIIMIYFRDIMQERVGLNLETTLRYATFDKLMKLDSQTISDYNSGELLQILNSDTIMFKEFFSHRIPYLIDAIFMLVMTLVMIFIINPAFIISPLIAIPFLVFFVLTFKKQAKINFRDIRAKSSAMNLTTQENIAAVRIVRSFTNEGLEKEKFEAVNKNYLNAQIKQIWLSTKYNDVLNSVVKQVTYIATIIIATVLVMNGRISVGFIMASSTYVMRLMNNVTSLNNIIYNMQQQAVSGLALKNFMEKESNVPDSLDDILSEGRPSIELKNVGVVIDEVPILSDINVSIPYGKKLGIVGETGAGKSMLLKTLVRIRDISDGEITINGHDIKEFGLKRLRDMYSYVFQDVFLFSNTIESNIAYAKPESEQKLVVEAAVHAKANNFIESFTDKYQTIVGERGIGVSGGQKQRISIARAFLKNAPIYVLDDSTSALDVNTERDLLKDIRENFSDKTVIITAHRLSSVVDCDEILYMQDGKIKERGTFDELMKLNGSFAEVYNIQQAQAAGVVDFDALAGKEGE